MYGASFFLKDKDKFFTRVKKMISLK